MYKKITFLLLSFSFLGGILCAQDQNSSMTKIVREAQKYNQFIYYLEKMYLDTVDLSKVTQEAIKSVLLQQDPHSAYVSKEELKRSNEAFEGNFSGIGVEFNVINDTVIVVNTMPGGPAAKVGMMASDRIISANGKSIIGVSRNDVPKILRGEQGTVIQLTVLRRNLKDSLSFSVVRDKIPLNSLDAAYLLTPQIGYVKFNRFMATTEKEFIDAMAKMPGIKGLVIDLRGNGGGFLDQAIFLSDQLLKDGSLIVYTEGRTVPRSDAIARRPGVFETGKVAILVDEESASASEIVAGAVQDWDRGIIVGRPTFGKGLVQRQIPLVDSSAIRLTVARYHTPSGRVIQRPYEKGDVKTYYANAMKRYSSGELMHADSLSKHIPDSLKYKTLVEGRTVYGGGGITPDIFVPMDSSMISKYWTRVFAKNILADCVIDYVDKNRKLLIRKYPAFDNFLSSFVVPDTIVADMITTAEKQGIPRDEAEIKRLTNMVNLHIKALIAQKLWDTNEFYRVVNTDNKILNAALEALNKQLLPSATER